MSKLITSKFRTHAAAQFIESFSEESNTVYYVGAHRSIPFTNDSVPPDPENTITKNHYELYDELVFGKHVSTNDVKYMIKNTPWTVGTVYDMYDDTVEDLESTDFFVVSEESNSHHVFKCLNNLNRATSTSQPLLSETSPSDEMYITSDGYQWKYMYSIDSTTYNKFATAKYIPVIPNANVVANAISGSIDTIIISDPGSQYNSYATGKIKEAAVNGNTLLYTLSSDKFLEYDVTVANVAGFKEEKATSTLNSKTSTGVIVAVFTANNTVRITNVDRAFKTGANLVGTITNSTSVIVSATPLNTALSSDAGFYKNNSFYIRSGTGAGQLRTIAEYYTTGDTRRVLLNAPLDVLPDIGSIYEIGPRVIINGDGVNANAVVIINPSANSIAEIEMIDSGSNYTYANITIIANTGSISNTSTYINTTSAKARAIISPPGGHGSDVVNELYANRVGIGMSFVTNESNTIPTSNDYRKISIIKDPMFANAELTLAYANGTGFPASNFTAGEYVVQANTGAIGQITSRSGSTIRLTNIKGFFNTGNTSVNYVAGQVSGANAAVVLLDRSFETFDQRQIYQVDITNTGPNAIGFQQDELVIQSGLDLIDSTIANGLGYIHTKETTSQLILSSNVASTFKVNEIITQANTGATGKVASTSGNKLTLKNTSGIFISGNSTANYVVGQLSTANAAVSSINNISVIGLTGVQGTFNLSDDASGTINTFVGQTNQATAKITGRDYSRNTIVDGSGKILYVENFTPITRSSAQTEKVKLIIEF